MKHHPNHDPNPPEIKLTAFEKSFARQLYFNRRVETKTLLQIIKSIFAKS